MRLARFNSLAGPQSAFYRHAVISIHGMNTRGAWQKQATLAFQDAGVRYCPVDYGFRIVRPILFPTGTADRFVGQVVDAWTDHDRKGLRIAALESPDVVEIQ